MKKQKVINIIFLIIIVMLVSYLVYDKLNTKKAQAPKISPSTTTATTTTKAIANPCDISSKDALLNLYNDYLDKLSKEKPFNYFKDIYFNHLTNLEIKTVSNGCDYYDNDDYLFSYLDNNYMFASTEIEDPELLSDYFAEFLNDKSKWLWIILKDNYLLPSSDYNTFINSHSNVSLGTYPTTYDNSDTYKIEIREYLGEGTNGGDLYATYVFDLNNKTFKRIDA
jgi:hypothetical protein